ncbi:MAG: hypothetical protein LBG12_10575 [Synergistaceae bacterium]|nr:hypothetical protein [Synergistaceae bacterium]
MGEKNLSTELIHAGGGRPGMRPRDALSVPETFPIYMTSAFSFESLRALDAVYAGDAGYIYSIMAVAKFLFIYCHHRFHDFECLPLTAP